MTTRDIIALLLLTASCSAPPSPRAVLLAAPPAPVLSGPAGAAVDPTDPLRVEPATVAVERDSSGDLSVTGTVRIDASLRVSRLREVVVVARATRFPAELLPERQLEDGARGIPFRATVPARYAGPSLGLEILAGSRALLTRRYELARALESGENREP